MLSKVLRQDLDIALEQLIDDLDKAKGKFSWVRDRLDDMDTTLKALGDSTSDHATRITALEGTSGSVGAGSVGETELNKVLKDRLHILEGRGNFNEAFTYDSYGNVTKQTVSGDVAYTVDYVYKDPVAGTLDYSETKSSEGGTNVTIKKVYTYNATTGNIESVATTTTIV